MRNNALFTPTAPSQTVGLADGLFGLSIPTTAARGR